jgi:hypothetical protein
VRLSVPRRPPDSAVHERAAPREHHWVRPERCHTTGRSGIGRKAHMAVVRRSGCWDNFATIRRQLFDLKRRGAAQWVPRRPRSSSAAAVRHAPPEDPAGARCETRATRWATAPCRGRRPRPAEGWRPVTVTPPDTARRTAYRGTTSGSPGGAVGDVLRRDGHRLDLPTRRACPRG